MRLTKEREAEIRQYNRVGNQACAQFTTECLSELDAVRAERDALLKAAKAASYATNDHRGGYEAAFDILDKAIRAAEREERG